MIKLFFSYSHKDEDLRNELDKHLSILKRQGILDTWHDRRIGAGNELEAAINKNLSTAKIILLLVSPDFLASDYCYDKEMTFAISMHEKKEAKVIPVILRPCDWHDAPFGKLLATPKDGKAVTKFSSLDEAFLEITNDVKDAIKEISPKNNLENCNLANFTPAEPLPRSSNLRVSRSFTDRERDEFSENAFEYIANYFEGSLKELQKRNPHIECKFKRLDTQNFTANIYKNGTKVCECLISYGSNSYSKGITYSNSERNYGGSGYNESLTVQDDGYLLSLRPLGMSFNRQVQESLTHEGAAEYFWQMLISPLQRN